MKRIITLFLTILLVFSSCLVTNNLVSAEENDEETINETTDNEVAEDLDENATEMDSNQKDNENEDVINVEEKLSIEQNTEETSFYNVAESQFFSTISPTDGSAYAVLTGDGDLVFFRSAKEYEHNSTGTFVDIYEHEYIGIVFNGIEDSDSGVVQPWDTYKNHISNVYVAQGSIIAPVTMQSWFDGCTNLTTFNGYGFDLERTSTINGLFAYCSNLKNAYLNFVNTHNLIHIDNMFYHCSSLKVLNLNAFNTPNVISMMGMFNGCKNLYQITFGEFDTSNVEVFSSVFSGCSSLRTLDLSSFNTSSAKIMQAMFNDCVNLQQITLGKGFTKWMNQSFLPEGTWANGSISKTEIELYDEYTTNINDYFGTWTKHDADKEKAYAVLTDDGNLIFFKSSNNYQHTDEKQNVIDVYENEYCGILFEDIENTALYGLKPLPWDKYKQEIIRVYVAPNQTIAPSSMEDWFWQCENLISFDGTGFDTSNCFSMHCLFSGCTKIESVNLNSFNTSNVFVSMSGMFMGCDSLKSLDLSSFDTSGLSKYSSYSQMLDIFDCEKLTSITLGSGWTTWFDEGALPLGNWYNDELGITKTEIELVNEYPLNAKEWSGTWKRDVSKFGSAYAVLTNDGDLVFCRSVNKYENGVTSIVQDVQGDEYYGIVFSDFETSQIIPWRRFSNNITGSIYVAKSQTISPLSMSGWFQSAKMKTFDGKGFDTSNVTDMSHLFDTCKSLTSLDISTFDTSSVTNMRYMFGDCTGLESLDLSNFNTQNVTEMEGMFNFAFSENSHLRELDLSSFNTQNVTEMGGMFGDCEYLQKIKIGSGFTVWSNDVGIPVGTWTNKDIGVSKTEEELCSEYPSHAEVWAGTWERDMSREGAAHAVLTDDGALIFIRSFDHYYEPYEDSDYCLIRDVYGREYIGKIYTGFENKDYGIGSGPSWLDDRNKVTKVYVAENQVISPISMTAWFCGFNRMTSFNAEGFDTLRVTSMYETFCECSALTSLDLSNFDTSNVTTMMWMFEDCSNLATIDLSSFNTERVDNMFCMFDGCRSLTSLNLSNFNTNNVTAMSYMFSGCKSLKELDISSFNTESVTQIQEMFRGCSSLSALSLKNFVINKDIPLNGLLSNCTSLRKVYIPSTMEVISTIEGNYNNRYVFENDNQKLTIYTDAPNKMNKWEEKWNNINDNEKLKVVYSSSYEKYNVAPIMLYYITYNTLGGNNNYYNVSYYDYGTTFKFKEPYRRGYIFNGWFTEDGTETGKWGTQIKSITKTTKGDLVLYAKWTPIKYTIKYVLNGGTNAKENKTIYTVESNLQFSDPVKKGYEFVCWTDENRNVITSTDGCRRNLVLSANYEIVDYNLTIDPSGGILVSKQSYDPRLEYDEDQKLYIGSYDVNASTIKLPTLEKDGYKFDGWYHDVWNQNKHEYVPTKISSIAKGSTGDKEIYALFTPVTYKISYNLNKGTISKTDIYDKSFNVETQDIVLPVPNRVGYEFAGWYLDKKFTIQSEVTMLDDLPYKNVTLFAKWIPNDYSITFISDRTNHITLDGYVYDQSYKLDNDIFDIPGEVVSKFTYSYKDSKGKTITKTIVGNASIKNLVSEAGGNIELYVAKTYDKKMGIEKELWSSTNYTIKYSLPNGVTNGSKNIYKYSYNESENVYVIKNPIKLGYDFLYWTYIDKEGNEQFIYPEEYDGTKDGYSYLPDGLHQNITLTPYFDDVLAVYDINYIGDLGSFEDYNPNPTTYSYDKTRAISLTNPNRAGYTFLGWYDVKTNKKITSIVKGAHGNLVLEARWNPIKYTIKYNLNGGVNPKGAPTFCYYDQYIELPTPTKKGYVFSGWYDNKSFDGYSIYEVYGSSCLNYSLFAKWEKE